MTQDTFFLSLLFTIICENPEIEELSAGFGIESDYVALVEGRHKNQEQLEKKLREFADSNYFEADAEFVAFALANAQLYIHKDELLSNILRTHDPQLISGVASLANGEELNEYAAEPIKAAQYVRWVIQQAQQHFGVPAEEIVDALREELGRSLEEDYLEAVLHVPQNELLEFSDALHTFVYKILLEKYGEQALLRRIREAVSDEHYEWLREAQNGNGFGDQEELGEDLVRDCLVQMNNDGEMINELLAGWVAERIRREEKLDSRAIRETRERTESGSNEFEQIDGVARKLAPTKKRMKRAAEQQAQIIIMGPGSLNEIVQQLLIHAQDGRERFHEEHFIDYADHLRKVYNGQLNDDQQVAIDADVLDEMELQALLTLVQMELISGDFTTDIGQAHLRDGRKVEAKPPLEFKRPRK